MKRRIYLGIFIISQLIFSCKSTESQDEKSEKKSTSTDIITHTANLSTLYNLFK